MLVLPALSDSRALVVILFGLAVALASCSDNSPATPTAEQRTSLPRVEAIDDASLQDRIVALQVETRARFRQNGDLEVRIWALCRRGYQVTESGPLAVTQLQGEREAYGEGFLQAQLGGCNGRWEGERVVVQQFEEPGFQFGRARVSVTFAVGPSSDPDANPSQVSVNKELRIR